MNEYNHHRIIERVALDCGLDAPIKKIFIEASDFTDFFIGVFDTEKPLQTWLETAKQKYYFYHFYYSINIENTNAIRLNRVTSNAFIFGPNNSIICMERAGEKELDGKYSLEEWSKKSNEKEFFSSVNDRGYSPQSDLGDTANQSDNVAFLHAMGAEGETAGDTGGTTEGKGKTSRSIFEDHLKKCFAEYLFLEKEEEALFMLGIAFHGIMDSFTPSHMGFQKYTEQDMGLHAQGDVIPIMGRFDNNGRLLDGNSTEKEIIRFDPGQFTKEILRNQLICIYKKRFGGNENAFVNPVEYRMLKLFFYISDIQVDYGNVWDGVGDIEYFWQMFRECTIKQINDFIGNGNYRYGPMSYVYSEASIKVISDIYKFLYEKRKVCKNYSEYKNNKQGILDDAIKYWIKIYDGVEGIKVNNCETEFSMKDIRDKHTILYLKDPDLDKEYEKYKESKEYKEWVAQQDIDRLNRLKG